MPVIQVLLLLLPFLVVHWMEEEKATRLLLLPGLFAIPSVCGLLGLSWGWVATGDTFRWLRDFNSRIDGCLVFWKKKDRQREREGEKWEGGSLRRRAQGERTIKMLQRDP